MPEGTQYWSWSLMWLFLYEENLTLGSRPRGPLDWYTGFLTCNERRAGLFSLWGQGLMGLKSWRGHQFWEVGGEKEMMSPLSLPFCHFTFLFKSSVVQSTVCSSRGPRFYSQQALGGSPLSVTPGREDLNFQPLGTKQAHM